LETESAQDQMNTPKGRILVVGTGAMASLFAARLSSVGISVVMLGTWKESIQALNRVGVRYIDAENNEYVLPVEATDDPGQCRGIQYALVLVKSHQTERAANQLGSCLAEDGLALTLQNGLDNREVLTQALGAQRVETGVTTLGATLVEPGVVRHGGEGVISIGESDRVQPLIGSLRKANFKVDIVEDTDSLIWGKLVINAAINPLTAILRVPNGHLLSNPSSRSLLGLLALETAEVARAEGVDLLFSDPIKTVETVADRTANNHSSMLKDVLRGSTTEIDAINGAIMRKGEEYGLPIQYNRVMWLLVRAISTSNGERPLKEHVHPLKHAQS
jgi:2-dehydropantoate 2-reductase